MNATEEGQNRTGQREHQPPGAEGVHRVAPSSPLPVCRGWLLAGSARGRTAAGLLGPLPGAGHGGTEVLGGDPVGVELAGQLAAQDHADRVREADELLEVGGDQQHSEALAPGLAHEVPDARLRADVDAAGRVRCHQHLGVVAHLAADDELLLVAARERAGGHVDRRGAHVVLLDDALGVGLGSSGVDELASDVGVLRLVPEDAVLPQRRLEEEGVAVPVLGDVADAGLADLAGAPVGDVGVAEEDQPGRGLAHPHDHLDELGLAVSLDAGDAEDLAGMDRERDVVEHRSPGQALQGEVLHPEHRAVGDRGLLGARRRQLRADHELGELAGVDALRVDRVDGRAAADHGDAVGDAEHLVELVRDEQDRQALLLELAEVVEELVDLLRHQHRGGLVENEGLGAAVEDLEDLDPLALPHTEVCDQLVGLDVEAVAVGDPSDLGPGLVADAVELLRPEDDVLEDGEVVGEHEVLEHHADAGRDGIGGECRWTTCPLTLMVPSSGRWTP